jgi:hypothetical protein
MPHASGVPSASPPLSALPSVTESSIPSIGAGAEEQATSENTTRIDARDMTPPEK